MNSLRVFVVGDSVAWGQGLLPDQKFHVLAAEQIATALNKGSPYIKLEAHSGAVIDPSSETPLAQIPYWREVPHSTPTILEQVRSMQCDPHYDQSVDLVILNGGINDIGFPTFLDPTGSLDDMDLALRQNCYVDMKRLLQETRSRFPNAVIVVVGYYYLISQYTDLDILRIVVSLLLLTPLLILLAEGLAMLSIRRVRHFAHRQLYWLRRAVNEMHASPATRGPGILFAHPAFGPRNSVGAPQALLFSPKRPRDLEDWWRRFKRDPLMELLALEIDDPMSDERRAACDVLTSGLEQLKCHIAPIGHPNPAGAIQCAETIRDRYLANHRVSLKEHAAKLLKNAQNLSLRQAFERYGLDPQNGLKVCLQHATVDVIEVTIKTKDEPFAGTDDDVYLRVSGTKRWLLNESLFEGDLANDFEQDKIGVYTIDPAEGQPDTRIHLGDIDEITLEKELTLGISDDWVPEEIKVSINGLLVHSYGVNIKLTGDRRSWTAPDYPGRL